MKNILVALEFKGTSAPLLEKASEFAHKFGSKLWLMHVADPPSEFLGEDADPQYVRDIRAKELRDEHRLIQQYAEQLKAKNILAEGLLVQGMTIEAILEEADKLSIDLIVMGIHEHGLLHDIFIGNNPSKIIKRSKVPVLVVPVDMEKIEKS
jgi:nucleotide-binding universal stress UspA family protein